MDPCLPSLGDLLPRHSDVSNDTLLDRFLDYTAGKRLALYPAQEEAVLALLDGQNVILNTPTGSGKSLVASAMLFAALARGERAVYTCPIKALVNERWMDLCREFGPEYVGLSTGDASVNREAPILCCTAEVLANLALREGPHADVQHVVMDEFHYYADRDRGVAWQTPLLTLPQTRFLLMSATLGDTTPFEQRAHRLNGRPTVTIKSATGPCHSNSSYAEIPLPHTIEQLVDRGQDAGLRGALHAGRRGQQRAGLHQPEDLHAGAEGRDRRPDRDVRLLEPLRRGCPQVAAARRRPPPRGAAAEVPCARRTTGATRPAAGDLRHRHARRRHQRADPDGGLHAPLQVRRPEDHAPDGARLPPDRRPRRPQGLRRSRLRRRPGTRARHREPAPRARRPPATARRWSSASRRSTTTCTGTRTR